VSTAPVVMVNSCTGRMGHATAEAIVRAGLQLVPYTLTGFSAGVAVSNIGILGIPVEVVGKDRRQEALDEIKAKYPNLIIVDYTLPAVVNENAEFYIRNRIPFVAGTTGGDRQGTIDAARAAGVYCIVSPQMGKQVVAFTAMMDLMADNFPGAFSGYSMEVVESHQSSKVDTSGTARDVVQSFHRLGVDFDEQRIQRIRDRPRQLDRMGVPEEALGGHAFHTYRLTSPDQTVGFVFKHNVVGRSTYAEGTVDAVLFLQRQIQRGAEQRVYSMVDVLKAGALR
jgi:4-hydroxy-tetrahydrodipicolinate reductase